MLYLIIGSIIGFIVAEFISAKNWGIKLCYAILCPVVFDTIVAYSLIYLTGSHGLAGAKSVPFFIGSIGYLIVVLVKMKVEKRTN